jgi:hypothetical protein
MENAHRNKLSQIHEHRRQRFRAKFTLESHGRFDFLALPSELRNKIYDYSASLSDAANDDIYCLIDATGRWHDASRRLLGLQYARQHPNDPKAWFPENPDEEKAKASAEDDRARGEWLDIIFLPRSTPNVFLINRQIYREAFARVRQAPLIVESPSADYNNGSENYDYLPLRMLEHLTVMVLKLPETLPRPFNDYLRHWRGTLARLGRAPIPCDLRLLRIHLGKHRVHEFSFGTKLAGLWEHHRRDHVSAFLVNWLSPLFEVYEGWPDHVAEVMRDSPRCIYGMEGAYRHVVDRVHVALTIYEHLIPSMMYNQSTTDHERSVEAVNALPKSGFPVLPATVRIGTEVISIS